MYGRPRTSSRDATEHNISSSHIDCSPIPFYSEQSSSLVAQSTSSNDSATQAAVSLTPFYDGPSMRDSIPVLLQHLIKSPPCVVKEATFKKQQKSFQKSKTTSKHAAGHAAAAAHSSGSLGSSSAGCVASLRPFVAPERSGLRSATPAKALAYSAAAQSKLSSSRTLRSGWPKFDARSRDVGGAVLQQDGGPKDRHPSVRRSGRGQPRSYTSGDAGTPLQPFSERGGMRYVVVQQPAVVYGAAYEHPSTSTSPDSTARLPSAPIVAETRLEQVTPPAPETLISTSPQYRSATHLRRSVSQDVSSSRGKSHSTDIDSFGSSQPPCLQLESAQPTQRTGKTSQARSSFESEPLLSADDAAHSTTLHGASGVSPGAYPSQSDIPTAEVATAGVHKLDHSSQKPCVSRKPCHSSTADAVDESTTCSPSARIRHLLTSIVDNPRATNTTGSRTNSISAHASELLSDAKETFLSAHATASPAAFKSATAASMAGGVESRGASPAARKLYPTSGKQRPLVTREPFSEAVMEGGDPLVLRHTIDYLLAKARRLERENAELWEQTHSWNPQRSITPSEASAVVVDMPRRQPRAADTPRKTLHECASMEKLRARTVGGAASALQMEQEPPRRQQLHASVPRERCSKAVGRPDPSVACASSPPSTPPSSSVSIDSRTAKSPPCAISGQEVREAVDDACATPRPTHHSLTVSSPCVAADPTATKTHSVTSACMAGAAMVQTQQLHPNDRELSSNSLSLPHDLEARVAQRVDAAVQHQRAFHDAGIVMGLAFRPPLQRSRRSSQATQSSTSQTASKSAFTPLTAAGATQSKPTLSPLGTPTRRNAHRGEAAVCPDAAIAPASLASTVHSHHSVESRCTVGSMTLRMTPPRAAVPQTQHTNDSPHGSSARHHQRRSLPSLNPEEHVAATASTAGAVVAFATSSASGASFGRLPTYNKQVQTAGILSPVEAESDFDTLFESNVDDMLTTASADRTSVIELHTSAAYNRSTVRRLRGYCDALETTRQQLRQRIATPTSPRSASWATSVAGAAGGIHLSRAVASSSRSSSTHHTFPLPLARRGAVHERVGSSSVGSAATSALPSPLLSRPFFQSGYTDPEVDATLYDEEEAPAIETVIVLQEDGLGTVTKRVVDGSSSRLSVSAGRSPSSTVHQPSQQQVNATASSTASYSRVDRDDAYPLSCVLPHFHGQLLLSPRSNTRRSSQGGSVHSDACAGHETYNAFNSSLRSDGNGREVVPSVRLGVSLRSDSAIPLPLPDQKGGCLLDIVPPTDFSMKARFVAPSVSPSQAQEKEGQQQQQRTLAKGTRPPPLQPYLTQKREQRTRGTTPTSVPAEVGMMPISDLKTVSTPASSTHSQRFAVPGINMIHVEVHEASSVGGAHKSSSNGSSGGTSQSADVGGTPGSASSTHPTASTPPPLPSLQTLLLATAWNPKGAAPATSASPALPPPKALVEGWGTDSLVNLNSAQAALDGCKPGPPSPTAQVSFSTATTSSSSSSQPFAEHDTDTKTPRELNSTFIAPAHGSAYQSKRSTHASENDGIDVRDSRESSRSGPRSQLSHLQSTGQATKMVDEVCLGTCATTAEFLDEMNDVGALHEVVRTRNMMRLQAFAAPADGGGTKDSLEGGGYCNADSFSDAEVDEADELFIPEPMPIERDSLSSDAEHSGGARPYIKTTHRVSPSPSRALSSAERDSDTEHKEASRVEAGGLENALDISESSSRDRCRLVAPLRRTPVSTLSEVEVDQGNSSSRCLSRSLYSFSLSDTDDEGENSDEGDTAEDPLHLDLP
ncbi:hypothetical protein ABL78_4769 [Leptomonas seymouri]|uniref:Uncharacterized protein n=1 Tax=Leptomonas seymouri TaxID=5684 RepID=A0A0N1PBT2_LEPSE|nr:hypothetical protein ABL78_4769 [Leptomonas seymouri]|eukprot:KPI86180.1 hypothetical protein ABL78_4769 [Leptomonas seymouri]